MKYVYIGGPRDETSSSKLYTRGYTASPIHCTSDITTMVHESIKTQCDATRRLLQAFVSTQEK